MIAFDLGSIVKSSVSRSSQNCQQCTQEYVRAQQNARSLLQLSIYSMGKYNQHISHTITANIQHIFHCFLVKDHRYFLRFLWYRDSNIVGYRMNVHVFENSPSPTSSPSSTFLYISFSFLFSFFFSSSSSSLSLSSDFLHHFPIFPYFSCLMFSFFLLFFLLLFFSSVLFLLISFLFFSSFPFTSSLFLKNQKVSPV